MILVITLVFSKIIAGFVNYYAHRSDNALPASSLLSNVTKIIILTFGVLLALNSLGVEIAPLLAALGIGGLAVALALQDTLSNIFAGFQILISKKVKPGDFIELDSGETGYIEDITWRNTTIRAAGNNHIIVPNSSLAAANLTNFYRPKKELSLVVDFMIDNNNNLQKVEEVAIEVATKVMKANEGGVSEYEPKVRFKTFNEVGVSFIVILRVKEVDDQYVLKHEFVKLLHDRFRQEGIAMAAFTGITPKRSTK